MLFSAISFSISLSISVAAARIRMAKPYALAKKFLVAWGALREVSVVSVRPLDPLVKYTRDKQKANQNMSMRQTSVGEWNLATIPNIGQINGS